MRTSQLYNQDKNNSFTLMCCQRFDTIKSVSNKRPQPTKSLLVNPLLKNPKHAEVLAESGIQYDCPLTPIEVATRRAERIAKEKLKNVVTVLASSVSASSSTIATAEQQQVQQQQQIHIVQQTQSAQTQQQQQIVATTTPQAHQLTQIVATAATGTSLKNAAITTTIASSVLPSVVTATVKASRASGGTLTMHDSRSAPTVVSVANLQAAQRLPTANLVPGAQTATGVVTQKGIVGVTMATASGSKTLTPAQIQYYRHQQVLRHHNLKLLQQAQVGQGQKVSVAVSAATGAQVRANMMKQSVAIGTVNQGAGGTVNKQNVTRTVTENDMATLLKRQAAAAAAAAQHQAQTKVGQVQVSGQQTGLTPAQIFAQAGLQVQQASTSTGAGTPVATLVKTANVSGVRAATPQQIRQLALHPQILTQRKMAGQKVAQLAQVKTGGVQTQLIVQQKSLPAAMTVQQIQQVMKHVQPSSIQQFTHVSSSTHYFLITFQYVHCAILIELRSHQSQELQG